MEATIIFNAAGHIEQRINITKEGLTLEALLEGLRTGEYYTTVQEKQKVLDINGEPVADILEVDNFCEYTDFFIRA